LHPSEDDRPQLHRRLIAEKIFRPPPNFVVRPLGCPTSGSGERKE
jgi:hypothetical protein